MTTDQHAEYERPYLCMVCQEERPPGLVIRGEPTPHFCPTVDDEQESCG